MKRVPSSAASAVRTAHSTSYFISFSHGVSTIRTYLKRTPACHTDGRGACIHGFQGHYAEVLPSQDRSSDRVSDKARGIVKELELELE